MNILIIPSWYPSKDNPEYGSFFRDQALALFEAGHKVTVLCVKLLSLKNCWDCKCIKKIVHENDNGIDTINFSFCSFGAAHFGQQYRVLEYAMKKAVKYIRKTHGNFDIVHAHSFLHAGYLACKCHSIFNSPIIVTEHLSSIGNNRLNKKETEYLAYTVNYADRFICVSNSLKDIVDKKTKTNKEISVLPNIVSNLFFYDESVQKNRRFSFIAAGGLNEIKQYDILIKAFKAFENNEKDVQLLICGEGPERSRLEEMIEEYNLKDKVFLLGHQSRKNLSKLFQTSHVFVHTSRSETFGVVIIEALASGLPVIGTLSGGPNEVLNSYGAKGVPVGDIDAIADSMKKIYDNYKTFDLKKISDEADDRYSGTAIIKKLTDLYLQSIQEYRKR